jgi:superfamily II DNA or RNA helicase
MERKEKIRRRPESPAVSNLEAYLSDPNKTSHLHPVQLHAMIEILSSLKSGKTKCYVTMPTGTGKSIIIATLVDAFSSKANIVTSRVNLTEQLSQSVTGICENHALGIVAGKYNNHADVTIGTYNAFRNNNLPQDSKITIFDEAHNLHGKKTNQAQEDNHGIQIGFTATPDYSKDRQLDRIFGKECFELKIADAIRQGLMSPFDEVKISIGLTPDNLPDRTERNACNAEVRLQSIISLYNKFFQGKKVVIKAVSIARAIEIEAKMKELGLRVKAVHKNTNEEVSDILDNFKKGFFDILIGVKIISEGFDMPDIDGVFFDNTPNSAVEVLQFAGRALRVNPENPFKRAKIVHVDNPDDLDKNHTSFTYSTLANIPTKSTSELITVPSVTYGNDISGRLSNNCPVEFPTGFVRPFAYYEYIEQSDFIQRMHKFKIPLDIFLREVESFKKQCSFAELLIKMNPENNSSCYHIFFCQLFWNYIVEKISPDETLIPLKKLPSILGRNRNMIYKILSTLNGQDSTLAPFVVYKLDEKWKEEIFFKPEVMGVLSDDCKAAERPKEGWLSKDDLITKYSIYINNVDIAEIKKEHPEWFQIFSNSLGQNYLFYSRDFALYYRRKYPLLEEADRSKWFTLHEIDNGKFSQKRVKIERRFFEAIFDLLSNENPNLAKLKMSYRAKNGSQTFYHIDLIQQIIAYIQDKSVAPEGYMSKLDIGKNFRVPSTNIQRAIKNLELTPIFVYNHRNQKIAYYSPEQITQIKNCLRN